ncbi:hypothetical protein ACFYTS_12365 [Nocardia sp. NPDC004151]|uniref:hypothetical protein n=1 Tax=Nocardia sp. NPDC004151 TaxID=3364304 RepID=UPI0036784C8D
MLPLDDPRWLELDHRHWSNGRPLGGEVVFVPHELRWIAEDPQDAKRFDDLWPYLCSEGTAWPAAYAAVPHLVASARSIPPAARGDLLYVVGLIVICSGEFGATGDDVPDDIAEAYRAALPEALTLATEQLATPQPAATTRYLLAATAALQGQVELGEFLNDLYPGAECESCGEPYYPAGRP